MSEIDERMRELIKDAYTNLWNGYSALAIRVLYKVCILADIEVPLPQE